MIQTMPARHVPGIRDGHPLALGLEALYVWLDGSNPSWRNIVEDDFHQTAFNTPTVVPSEFGRVVSFDDGSTEYTNHTAAALSGVPVSMACWFRSDVDGVAQTLMCLGNSGETDHRMRMDIRGDGPGDPLRAEIRGGGASVRSETTTGYSVGVWHHGVAVFETVASRRSLIDAGSKGTETTSVTPTLNNTSIGGYVRDGGPVETMSGQIAFPGFWGRALTDLEVKWLYDEPWSLITPRRKTYFMVPAVVGGNPWWYYQHASLGVA